MLFRSRFADIVAERALTPGTIATHIETLFMQGEIDTKTLEQMIAPELREALPRLAEAFEKYGSEKLAPLHHKLGGAYTYADLQLARLLCA